MRISVRSRQGKAGSEPCSLCLGGAQLHVTRILERRALAAGHRFQVCITGGRRLVLLHTPADRWELRAVYAPAPFTSRSAARRGG